MLYWQIIKQRFQLTVISVSRNQIAAKRSTIPSGRADVYALYQLQHRDASMLHNLVIRHHRNVYRDAVA